VGEDRGLRPLEEIVDLAHAETLGRRNEGRPQAGGRDGDGDILHRGVVLDDHPVAGFDAHVGQGSGGAGGEIGDLSPCPGRLADHQGQTVRVALQMAIEGFRQVLGPHAGLPGQ
jgi:hypothetical protein